MTRKKWTIGIGMFLLLIVIFFSCLYFFNFGTYSNSQQTLLVGQTTHVRSSAANNLSGDLVLILKSIDLQQQLVHLTVFESCITCTAWPGPSDIALTFNESKKAYQYVVTLKVLTKYSATISVTPSTAF